MKTAYFCRFAGITIILSAICNSATAEEVIDQFEGREKPGKQWIAFGSLKPHLTFSLTEEKAKQGKQSMKVQVASGKGYVVLRTPIKMGQYDTVSLWVYGDGNNGHFKVQLNEPSGDNWSCRTRFYFKGWKHLILPKNAFTFHGGSNKSVPQWEDCLQLLFVVEPMEKPMCFYVDDLRLKKTSKKPASYPALNHDPQSGVGERPLGMKGRPQKRKPLVDFEYLRGWETACYYGADARLYRTRQEQIWGDYVGRVEYTGTTCGSYFEIRPKHPILIPERFDAVNLWCYGNSLGWVKDPTTPRVSLSVRIVGADGQRHDIPLGTVNWKYWFLLHRRIAQKIKFPAKFVSIVVKGGHNTQKRGLYFDNLIFYNEPLKPLKFAPRPKKYPFPTTPDTILPTQNAPFTNTVRKDGDGFVFAYNGDDCKLEYMYKPTDGTLGDISVVYNGKKRFRTNVGGGVSVELAGKTYGPTDKAIAKRLLSADLNNGQLKTRWQWSKDGDSLEFDLSFRIKQKSLVIEAKSDSDNAVAFDLGRSEGTPGPRLIQAPYLYFLYTGAPRILYSDGLFVSAFVDWYVSEASEIYVKADVASKNSAFYNGGTKYVAKTDGKRNALGERIFLTVTPEFTEALPNIPNPPSPMRDVMGHRLYLCQRGNNYAAQLKSLLEYKRYGLDHVFVRHHESTWNDYQDGIWGGFTCKLDAAPRAGGDKALRNYVRQLHKETGWLVALYTNYADFATVEKSWDEDWVTRTPEGQWRRAWPRCYNPKPLRAVEAEAYYAPRIHEKFGTMGSYCDVHTCVTPWHNCDYDARAPGAGKFKITYYAYGELLLNERRAHQGPVFSEGATHWIYAGLVDGNYANFRGQGHLPMLVDFDLLKIHPLEMDVGAGPCNCQFGKTSRGMPLAWNIATTVAYGHLGELEAIGGFINRIKYYYMIQQLQSRYAMVKVDKIRYWDGSQLLPTSQALARDIVKRNQVYVRYANGLEIFVNCNAKENWTVEANGKKYLLPPSGFVACCDDLLEYSALLDGHRVDYVSAPDYVYLDARGKLIETPEVAADGAVAVRRLESGMSVINVHRCSRIVLYPRCFSADSIPAPLEVDAYDMAGNRIGKATVEVSPRQVAIKVKKNQFEYKIKLQ